MLRLLIVSLVIGTLAFLIIYLVSPFIVAEADVVALAAQITLGLSNLFYENMPPGVSGYVNHLNLLVVAVTVALLLILGIPSVKLIFATFVWLGKGIASLFHREPKQEPKDLPPIDMVTTFKSTGDGKHVAGRGLDSIDRD